MAEIHPNRPDSRIYSAFLSKDNLLFFLSARSKQELENLFIAKIRDGALYYIHVITTTFGFLCHVIPFLGQIYIFSPGSI